jgi:hypothetical protein
MSSRNVTPDTLKSWLSKSSEPRYEHPLAAGVAKR